MNPKNQQKTQNTDLQNNKYKNKANFQKTNISSSGCYTVTKAQNISHKHLKHLTDFI